MIYVDLMDKTVIEDRLVNNSTNLIENAFYECTSEFFFNEKYSILEPMKKNIKFGIDKKKWK